MNVWDDTSACDGSLNEGVQFLISTNGQLQMARGDTLDFQILASIPSQLQNLSSQVLQDGSGVHSCSGTNTAICLSPLLQLTVDTSNRELKAQQWKLAITYQGLVYFQKILQNMNNSTFVCIWQILSNHRLTRLKRFVSQITRKLYN